MDGCDCLWFGLEPLIEALLASDSGLWLWLGAKLLAPPRRLLSVLVLVYRHGGCRVRHTGVRTVERCRLRIVVEELLRDVFVLLGDRRDALF